MRKKKRVSRNGDLGFDPRRHQSRYDGDGGVVMVVKGGERKSVECNLYTQGFLIEKRDEVFFFSSRQSLTDVVC